MTQHYEVIVSTKDDGTIQLRSPDPTSDEDDTIWLHRDQLRLIADRYAPSAAPALTTPADVVLRRFQMVVEAVREAAWEEWLYKDIWESCDNDTANALYVGLNAAMAMADQFIADSESVINVTPVTDVTRNACNAVTERNAAGSNAARQAEYRARKKSSTTPATDAPAT